MYLSAAMDTIPPIGAGSLEDGSFDSLSGEATPAGQSNGRQGVPYLAPEDDDDHTVVDRDLGLAFADTHHETPAFVAPHAAVAYSDSGEFEIDPWDIATGPIAATVAPIAERIAEAVRLESPLSDVEIAQETSSMYRAEIAQLREFCSALKELQKRIDTTWSDMSPDELTAAQRDATIERFSLKAQLNTLMCIVIPDILSSLEKAKVVTFDYNSTLNATTSEPIPVQLGNADSFLTVARIGDNGNEYSIKRPQKNPNDTSRNSVYLHADDTTGALLFASYRQTSGTPQDILHLVGPNVDEVTSDANLIKMGLCVNQVTVALLEKLESVHDEKR